MEAHPGLERSNHYARERGRVAQPVAQPSGCVGPHPASPGTPPIDRASFTPRTMACATASAAATPSAFRSALASPTDNAITTSPSAMLKTGEIARAIPAEAICASRVACGLARPALVATTTNVVFSFGFGTPPGARRRAPATTLPL